MAVRRTIEDIARDIAAMPADHARAEIKGEGRTNVLEAYIQVETRPALVKLAQSKLANRPGQSLPEPGTVTGKPRRKVHPAVVTTEAAYAKVAAKVVESVTGAIEDGDTLNGALDTALADVTTTVLDQVENIVDQPLADADVTPTPAPKAEPEGQVVSRPKRKAKPEPAPAPAPEVPKGPRRKMSEHDRGVVPPPAVRSDRAGFTDAEISAAASRFGAERECTKCGETKPLVTGFGLRRMGIDKKTKSMLIRPQPQCRRCRVPGKVVHKGPKRR